MKRILPFLIIMIVGLMTVGIATAVYRHKVHPANATAASASPLAAAPATKDGADVDDGTRHVQGRLDAPVKLEIYGDFQCPSCAGASTVIGELQKEYGNRLCVIYYEFPLAMHQHSTEAALAAEAAGLQGKFWEMHDALYQYQNVWSRATNVNIFFETYAQTLGLDLSRFRADRASPVLLAQIHAQADAGSARGVENTPTLFVNGEQLRTAFSKESLKATLDQALAKKKGS
jgi:protein-disulfide isomerase